MFGPTRQETIWEWRNLHNEELHKIIRTTNSSRMRLVGYAAYMGDRECAYISVRFGLFRAVNI
jgi:hypothetical protein